MKPFPDAVRPLADRPLVVVLNNDILPYRIPLFRALDAAPGLRFHFIFSTERAWDRSWRVDRKQLGFPHTVLRGFALRLRKPNYGEWRTIYINPTLFLHLLRLRPDVIVGYEYSAPALTALLYARLCRAAYVVWTECTRHAERELTRGQRWTRRLILPRAQAYIGTSQAACENLVHSGAPVESVFASPMSHAVAWFRDESSNARKEPSPGAAHRILYVGALSVRKGVTSLLEAFALVARQQPEARLILVGDGPLRSSLEDLARRLGVHARVEFGGFVQPAELPAIYAQAGVFVLPSLEDTFGVVVVEAMACGVPVVCSKYAGASSHLVDGVSAFLVDPEDIHQVADRILRLQSDAGLRSRFASEGRRLAGSFEASAVAEPFLDASRAALDRLRR
jgi:glycosyltransferase involved in cell wall biosynthesis